MAASNTDVAIRISAKNTASPVVRQAKADVKDLESATSSLGNRGSKSFSDLNKATQGLQSSLERMATRTVVGLGALTAGAVGWGLKTASSFELSKSALGALNGSVAEGNKMFAQLQKYNFQSPFNFQGVTDAAQTLMQMGVSGDKALAILKGIGDVASLSTDPTNNLTGMALAMGQISSAGKLFSQDLNQLTSNRFPAWRLAAEVTGKSIGQLRREMSSGTSIPAGPFVAAVETMNARALAAYKGGAKKQNDTLYGQWSNFKDMLAKNLEQGIHPVVPEIKKEMPVLAKNFSDAIKELGPQLPSLVDSLVSMAPAVADITKGFADLVGATAPVVSDVAHLMGPKGMEALLGAMVVGGMALKLADTAKSITAIAKALRLLAAAEVVEDIAGGATIPGIPGRVTKRGLRLTKGGRLVAVGAGVTANVIAQQGKDSLGKDAATVGSAAFTGGMIGKTFGWPGAAIGTAAGTAVGAAEVGLRRTTPTVENQPGTVMSPAGIPLGASWLADPKAGGTTIHGGVHVRVDQPNATPTEISEAVAVGIANHVRERQARGGG